ncbi:MAG TPA: endopeptidase La [Anaerolineae bacterium]|nr:endopeptidase La [Anaerolineae bacterium]
MSRFQSDVGQGSAAFGDIYPPGISELLQTSPRSQALEGMIELPLLPVRDTVLYPRLVSPLFVGRDRSMKAIEAAQVEGKNLLVVAQRDPEAEDPRPEDLYGVGCNVSIVRTLRMPDGTTSILTQGQHRAEIVEYVQIEPYFRARARLIEEPADKPPATEALMRAVLALFEKVISLNRSLPEDAYIYAMNIEEPGWLADLVASTIDIDIPERQHILEIFDPATRLQALSIRLAKKLDVLELEDQIHSRVQREVDRSQREMYLREQMKAIQTELGEGDLQAQELNELRERIAAKKLPDEVRAKAHKELERLQQMPMMAPEVGIIRTYLDWIVDLPWTEATTDNLAVTHAAQVLDQQHHGLPKAKERILEYIAVRRLAADKMRSPILCFVGPPGTGKTSLGKSIAEALGRKFVRVSLGGIHDEAEIRGHRRTYIGALPGRIIQTMRRAESVNPLFMLDEIDKVGADFRGDPSAALLEALDPEQNYSFSDHYLDLPYDLSRVMFVTTANILDTIPPALRDRMEVIEFPGYIEDEKLMIAKKFVIPKQLNEHGLQAEQLHITDDAIRSIIREYTYEAGVRNLERELANICRKTARRVAEEKRHRQHVAAEALHRYLGPPRFIYGLAEEKDQIGVATSVAWTDAGGDIMPIEVSLMQGKGTLMLTGQLGEVMQESAQAAVSYMRSRAKDLGIERSIFEKTDIHIHIPEGAIPKDGPSAGITMATALISAFTHRPVRRDVGMTGEITLRGRVLPIGGLREKMLAAHRAGLKTVIVPKKNQKDLIEIPKKVQRDLKFHFVESMDEVLALALSKGKASKKKKADGKPARAARAAVRSRTATRRPATPH